MCYKLILLIFMMEYPNMQPHWSKKYVHNKIFITIKRTINCYHIVQIASNGSAI
jgi:hypothetical protein